MDLTHPEPVANPDENDVLNLDNYEFGIKIDVVEEHKSEHGPSIIKAYDVRASFQDDFKPEELCRRCYTIAEVIEAVQHVSANIETEMVSFLKTSNVKKMIKNKKVGSA